jgi:hypothetical protein
MVSSFRSFYMVVSIVYTRPLVNMIELRICQYMQIRRYSQIYIQILIGHPESGISDILIYWQLI